MGERKRNKKGNRDTKREKWKGILVDFEVTLWMKMNIFHDSWFVNDLKEICFSQSIFTRLLCIWLLEKDIRNVLIFWFKMELMWIWKKWGFLFCFWFWQTHKSRGEESDCLKEKREREEDVRRCESWGRNILVLFFCFYFFELSWRVKEEVRGSWRDF